MFLPLLSFPVLSWGQEGTGTKERKSALWSRKKSKRERGRKGEKEGQGKIGEVERRWEKC